MSRETIERKVKELSVAVSRLLELYQWDHLKPDINQAKVETIAIKEKLKEVIEEIDKNHGQG